MEAFFWGGVHDVGDLRISNELKRRMQGAVQVFRQELGGLRTGRASAGLLEPRQAEAYGSHMPLNQLATVSVPEPPSDYGTGLGQVTGSRG